MGIAFPSAPFQKGSFRRNLEKEVGIHWKTSGTVEGESGEKGCRPSLVEEVEGKIQESDCIQTRRKGPEEEAQIGHDGTQHRQVEGSRAESEGIQENRRNVDKVNVLENENENENDNDRRMKMILALN